jgi:hypothetical protein
MADTHPDAPDPETAQALREYLDAVDHVVDRITPAEVEQRLQALLRAAAYGFLATTTSDEDADPAEAKIDRKEIATRRSR